MTRFLRPEDLDDALRLRARHPDYALLAGGTDLMVALAPALDPVGIIDVFGLRELRTLAIGGDAITLGAGLTYRELLEEERLLTLLPIVGYAAREIGALQIQARGTIGGNIATSSPVGDTLPVWLALDAEIELASLRGRRRVPYRDFITGYRKTAIASDEIIINVVVDRRSTGSAQYWRKVGTRRAQAISKVMVAATADVTSGLIANARVAYGAVADRPIRIEAAERCLDGQPPSSALADAAAAAVEEMIRPIDDVRSTARYRAVVGGRLLRRWILDLAASSPRESEA